MLALDRDAIADVCRQFGVRRLAVFGSAVSGRFDPERSDVDLLVEFADDAPRTMTHYFDLKDALEALLGREVDLVESSALRNPLSSRPSRPARKSCMRPESPAYLWDAREAARLELRFVADRAVADFETDAMLQSAVERQFITIGEALNRLHKVDPMSRRVCRICGRSSASATSWFTGMPRSVTTGCGRSRPSGWTTWWRHSTTCSKTTGSDGALFLRVADFDGALRRVIEVGCEIVGVRENRVIRARMRLPGPVGQPLGPSR